MIKETAKILIEKKIYPKTNQVKTVAKTYVQDKYLEYFRKFTMKEWNIYFVNHINRPVKKFLFNLYLFFRTNLI